ncbi:MAG: endo alpha-1,4 polygalactosaminidase [Acidimicrobiaceae bacterium]|nr:endo alpha-1,4 polygalactosaminidase [Ilumatobacter sp.]MCB9381630.1 endo alpha-1,4 polygalactosaminidase [Acidimicrobiaceae bacterium]
MTVVGGGRAVEVPPAGAGFDYQLGGDAPLPAGVTVVVRDWFAGTAAPGAYSVCYINAFQTQPPDADDRPDLRGAWPAEVVSTAEDPEWPGEFAIDLSSAELRATAAAHVTSMIDTCATKGFRAVEFDNLDSFTRFPELGFGADEALAYAADLVEHAHALSLAAGQKNSVEIAARGRAEAGFDFAVVEECGQYDECGDYTDVYGDEVFAIEYTQAGFAAACAALHPSASVILRDLDLVLPDDPGYLRQTCP